MYVRSDKMRASKIMRARVEANEKIEVVFNTEIQSYEGDSFLTHINLINNKTNEKYQKKIGGVFMGKIYLIIFIYAFFNNRYWTHAKYPTIPSF